MCSSRIALYTGAMAPPLLILRDIRKAFGDPPLLDGAEQSFIHVGEKNSQRLPASHRFDTAVHYKFDVGTSRVDVGLSVFNLYNRQNVWYKEFDLTESPMVTTDVTFLGFTPNLSVRLDL